MAKFFAFDGIDRAGKTSEIVRVQEELETKAIPVDMLMSGHIGGVRVADVFGVYPDEVVYMLFWQALRLLDIQKIQPALAAGSTVLCDRYMLSNLGHNWWTDLDLGFQKRMAEEYLARLTIPDVYFLFTIPYEVFLERDDGDTKMDEHLFAKMQMDYLLWSEKLLDTGMCEVVCIDGSLPVADLHGLVMNYVQRVLAMEETDVSTINS